MSSLLPHDLCHGRSASRWPPTQTHSQGFLAGVLSVQWGVGPGDSEHTAEEARRLGPLPPQRGVSSTAGRSVRARGPCHPGSLSPPFTALLSRGRPGSPLVTEFCGVKDLLGIFTALF